MAIRGYLGIDAGTQGLSIVFTDESLRVLASSDADYAMVPGLGEGCYEQQPSDWEQALRGAAQQLHAHLRGAHHDNMEVLGVGISGQMHGEVLTDASGAPLAATRLWCDARNDAEGAELTAALEAKVPKRLTAARWLWTLRNRPDVASQVRHITTPAGWISHRLTGEWVLGIGDASGMFPIDQGTLNYDSARLNRFHELAGPTAGPSLAELLPTVRRAGEDGGTLNAHGGQLLGLPEGIPVAPAEGDQPAALAGSLIGNAGMVSMSFGTSVCANSVGDRTFAGVSEAIDHFCAVDGKPINMVLLRNGTTFMNTVVEMFGLATNADRETSFANVIPQLLHAPDDCGGLLALPFMDDEPGLGVSEGGTALLVGLNATNARPGHVAKAALLSTIFNLRVGSDVLDAQGFPRTEIVLSGGLTKTPELGQLVADVFNTPVRLLASAEEGTAWGAALLARFRHAACQGNDGDWATFLDAYEQGDAVRFEPREAAVQVHAEGLRRYRGLLSLNDTLRAQLA